MTTVQRLAEQLDRQLDRFYGKYRGLVKDDQDPSKRGRLKVTVPEVLGDQASGWAMPCVPYAGEGAGFYSIPVVGAGVWVEFEAGDPSRPVWVGCWWAKDEAPKSNKDGAADPKRKQWRTEAGLMVTMDDASKELAVSDKDGANVLTIKIADGIVELKGKSKVVLEAPVIDHGEGAGHPVVFGDDLLQYLNQLVSMFNSHLHPGQLAAGIMPVTPAPPTPSFPSASSSLLSTKNLVE